MVVVENFHPWAEDASSANVYGILTTDDTVTVHIYVIADLQHSITVSFNATPTGKFAVLSNGEICLVENLQRAFRAYPLDGMNKKMVAVNDF